jgi:DNA-directed RNA polymerase subunit RPC12/RpoP
MSGDNPSQKLAVCTCNTCSAHLEFEPANAGTAIQCPQCGMETVLFIPQVAVERTTADIVERTTYEDADVQGRLELTQVTQGANPYEVVEHLENAGTAFLALGIVGGVIAFAVAVGLFSGEKPADAGVSLVVGVVALVTGFVLRILFMAGAQIIRLLEESNRSKFTGKITQLSVRRSYNCSRCNAAALPGQARCLSCGAEFKA